MKHTCLSVSGSRGTGKSTLVHNLLAERHVRRRLVMDPLADYQGKVAKHCSGWAAVDDYCNSKITGDFLGSPSDSKMLVSEAQQTAWQADEFSPYNKEFSVAYCPEDISESNAAAYLALWARHLRNCTLIIEEAHDACRHPDCPPELITLAKRGRHFNVGLWTISQRPSDVSPHLRSELNSNESWYLRLTEAVDLDVMKERRGKRFAEAVARLENFQAVRILPGQDGWERWHITPGRIHMVGVEK